MFDASERGMVKHKVTFSNDQAEISEDSNGGIELPEAQYSERSNRDDLLDTPNNHDFDARKFSAASVDVLIGKSNFIHYRL